MKPAAWILLGAGAIAAYLVVSAQRRAAEAARASRRSTGEVIGGIAGETIGASPAALLGDAAAAIRGLFSDSPGPVKGSSAEDYQSVDWADWGG